MSGVRVFRDEAFVARPAAEVFEVYLDVETSGLKRHCEQRPA